jgi:hypothetical protein
LLVLARLIVELLFEHGRFTGGGWRRTPQRRGLRRGPDWSSATRISAIFTQCGRQTAVGAFGAIASMSFSACR